MPRIPYPDPATLTPKVQQMLAGSPINVVRIGAHASPNLFEAQGMLSYAIADPTVLPPRLRETVILRVGHLAKSAYELHHHAALGKAAGLTDAEMTAIASRDYASLEPTLAAAAAFTDEVVQNVSPSDEALALLRTHVSDRYVINITLTIGCYMSIARLIAVGGIEIDDVQISHLATGIDDQAE